MNIVITGASRGLGKAFANIFAKNGHSFFLCSRNEAVLKTTIEELKNTFPQSNFSYVAIDISIKDEAIRFANWCLSFGTPDILINNAGSFIPGSVYNEPDMALEEMMASNLYAAYHVTRTVLPKMMERKSGHIFNMCSIASIKEYPSGGSYSISKFALLGFSKNLREELKPFNIKVTSIIPGATYTDSWKNSGVDEKRLMQENDIAQMVYAASKLSVQACVEEIIVRPQLGDL